MKNRRNYYRLLQVQPDAPLEIIRAGYRAMMRDLERHPDLGGSTAEAALLNEAYEVLSDPERRAAYDLELFDKYTKRLSPRQGAGGPRQAAPVCPFCRSPQARTAGPEDRCRICGSPLREDTAAEADRAFRRSVTRMKKNDRISYYSAWPQKAREGRMIDLSPKGMRIVCTEKIPKGTLLKISSSILKAVAEVTNSRAEAGDWRGAYAVGLRFVTVEFEDEKGSFFSASV